MKMYNVLFYLMILSISVHSTLALTELEKEAVYELAAILDVDVKMNVCTMTSLLRCEDNHVVAVYEFIL